MKCLACNRSDGLTQCGGLLCHDCKEAGRSPAGRSPAQTWDSRLVAFGLSFIIGILVFHLIYEAIGATLP